jgi:threonine-phosphate decarboxylase
MSSDKTHKSGGPTPWPQEHGGAVHQLDGSPVHYDFSASINPLGQPPGLLKALEERWGETLHYPDRTARRLVQSISKAFGVAPECLLAGNGSTELIELLFRVLKPARTIITAPDFGLYTSLLPEGAVVTEVPRLEEEGFAVDLKALASELREGDLAIFSNPGNPSGHALNAEEVLALAKAAQKAGAHLVVDEAFADFIPEISVIGEVSALTNLVVLRSMTKFFAIPGLRLGFVAANEALVKTLAEVIAPWSVSTIAQIAGEHCLVDENWGAKTRQYVEMARTKLAAELASLEGFEPLPSTTNYILVRLAPPAPDAGELYTRLKESGTAIRHCASFGLGERYIRLAVRTVGENADLIATLKRTLSTTGGSW